MVRLFILLDFMQFCNCFLVDARACTVHTLRLSVHKLLYLCLARVASTNTRILTCSPIASSLIFSAQQLLCHSALSAKVLACAIPHTRQLMQMRLQMLLAVLLGCICTIFSLLNLIPRVSFASKTC